MLLAIDQTLFALINGAWTHPWLDGFMLLVTEERYWMPLLLLLWLSLAVGFGGRKRALALVLLLVIGSSDVISSRVLKNAVGRRRPCCVESVCRHVVPCKGSKSFPSSHAANTGAAAAVVWLEEGAAVGLPLALLALAVSYSRVYTGVHYPLDVLAGLAVGCILAWIGVRLRRRFFPPASAADLDRKPGGR